MTENIENLPVGSVLPALPQAQTPARKTLAGKFISLQPIDAQRDVIDLYAIANGDAQREKLWTYMAYGPFSDQPAMLQWLELQQQSADPLFFAVVDNASDRRVGMVAMMSIVLAMRRLELGNIWYGPEAQRGKTNTEAVYLMLCETFEQLQYRRAEWKCDALNARSRAAALRLGFKYEGLFRQHMIIKGRNRDTAWFAMMDHEWPAIKANMERWLYADEEGLSLAQLNQSG
jgi:RimJ/RimL family protein N-acetyltransferase